MWPTLQLDLKKLILKRPEFSILTGFASCKNEQEARQLFPDTKEELERLEKELMLELNQEQALIQKLLMQQENQKKEVAELERVARSAVELDRKLLGGMASEISLRIRQGRASLWNDRLERHLLNSALFYAKASSEGELLGMQPDQLAALEVDLKKAAQLWIEFVLRRLDEDLELVVFDTFTPLERDLIRSGPVVGKDLILLQPWREAEDGWWNRFEPPNELVQSVVYPPYKEIVFHTIRSNVVALSGILALIGMTLGGLGILLVPLLFLLVLADNSED
jgi:hypothetical protein